MTESNATPPPIGQIIAEYRAAKSLSLQELSKLSGVSKGMISQVENGQVNPTLAIVWKIASGLGIRLQDLFDEESSKRGKADFTLLTRENCPVRINSKEGYDIQILSSEDMVQNTELYLLRIEPSGAMNSAPHAPGTIETLTVFEGEVEIVLNDERHIVQKLETARYSADSPHHIRGLGKERALAYLTVKYTNKDL